MSAWAGSRYFSKILLLWKVIVGCFSEWRADRRGSSLAERTDARPIQTAIQSRWLSIHGKLGLVYHSILNFQYHPLSWWCCTKFSVFSYWNGNKILIFWVILDRSRWCCESGAVHLRSSRWTLRESDGECAIQNACLAEHLGTDQFHRSEIFFSNFWNHQFDIFNSLWKSNRKF